MLRANQRIGHETFAGEFPEQRLSQENGANGTGKGGEGGPRDGSAVSRRPAPEQSGNALEIIVGPIGEGEKGDGDDEKDGHGKRKQLAGPGTVWLVSFS